MNIIDGYLLSLPFVDGHPGEAKTTFIEIYCACGAAYATRVSQFETGSGFIDPVSDRAILESDARCPHCRALMNERARTATMHFSHGFAMRQIRE